MEVKQPVEHSTYAAFAATFDGLERGLTVQTITSTPLQLLSLGEEYESKLASPEFLDFDVVPIHDNGRIIGVIERRKCLKIIRPLDSSILVAADQPLSEFLASGDLLVDGYRLVLNRNKIDGIVTYSDLLRLPVRVFAFTLISHLEETLSRTISARASAIGTNWLDLIKDDPRRNELREVKRKLQHERLNPDLLEFTQLLEKIKILKAMKVISNNDYKELGGIVELRHQIAHLHNYANSIKSLEKFIDRLNRTRKFIDRFESRL